MLNVFHTQSEWLLQHENVKLTLYFMKEVHHKGIIVFDCL